jgi:hypothetical protein
VELFVEDCHAIVPECPLMVSVAVLPEVILLPPVMEPVYVVGRLTSCVVFVTVTVVETQVDKQEPFVLRK